MHPKIGLALGSGGARGWSHIGVLRALEDAGIAPDIVCGTSMGSLVGACHAAGILDGLESFARSLAPLGIAGLVDINLRSGGLVSGQKVVEMLGDLGLGGSIADLGLPYMAVATDLANGREVWLHEGDIRDAVRASIGIPGVFSPVHHDGRWLLDGGMSNPVPVSCCRALGAEIIIAVNPNGFVRARFSDQPERTSGLNAETLIGTLPSALQPVLRGYLKTSDAPRQKPPGYLDVIAGSVDIMTDKIMRARLAGDPPSVMVDVPLDHMTIFDFNQADRAIAAGREAMAAQIDTLKAQL